MEKEEGRKKQNLTENYLENRPQRLAGLNWTQDEAGTVTLEKENTGLMNRLAQKLLGKPKVSYIHLDELGSFLWPLLDGEQDLTELGKRLSAQFGEKAEPLYPRLAKYIQVLHSYGFVEFEK